MKLSQKSVSYVFVELSCIYDDESEYYTLKSSTEIPLSVPNTMPVVPGPTRPGNYPYRIPSIHEKNPTLPPVLVHINISKSIAKRDVLNRQDLLDARAIASALRSLKGK